MSECDHKWFEVPGAGMGTEQCVKCNLVRIIDDWKDCETCDSPHEHKQHLLINKLHSRLNDYTDIVSKKDEEIATLRARISDLEDYLLDSSHANKCIYWRDKNLDVRVPKCDCDRNKLIKEML